MGALWNRRKGVGERAEVYEEIFELDGPIAAHHALDAAAGRVAGLGGVEVGGRRGGADADEPGRDGEDGGDDLVAVNSAIGKTSGGVEQPRRSRENAGSCPHRAEPYELFLVAQGDVGRQGAGKGAAEAAGGRDVRRRRAALAAALDVGLKTEQPVAGIPIVADLATADHAVELGRHRRKQYAVIRRVMDAAEAAADVQADVPAAPDIHWRRGR